MCLMHEFFRKEVMSILNFNFRKFKSDFPSGNDFQVQKLKKYKESKNALKKPLGGFNQEIQAILIFHTIGKIANLRAMFPLERCSEISMLENSRVISSSETNRIFFDEKGVFALRNIAIFPKKKVIKKQR